MRSILFCRTLLGPLHSVELEASEPAVEQLQVPLTGPFRSGLILHTTPPETQRQIKFSLSGCTQTKCSGSERSGLLTFLWKQKLSEDKKFVSVNESPWVFIQFGHKNNLFREKFFIWSNNNHIQWTRPDPTRPDALRCSIVTSPDFLLCSRWLRGFTCGSSGFTSWWTLSNDILQHHYKY